MAQREIEVILTRQLASYLATPMFLVDASGRLLFFNEPAEALLGRRFEETGEMGEGEWSSLWSPCRDDGTALPVESLPLAIALAEGRPAHDTFWIADLDGVRRRIEAVAVPLVGQAGRSLGAVVVFWEKGPS